jgi:hypothetical protein
LAVESRGFSLGVKLFLLSLVMFYYQSRTT